MHAILKLILVPVLLTLAACSGSGSKAPLTSTAQIDLSRYMGRWWVIANIPYFAENGKVATADVYALRSDGKIDNIFVYRKAFGEPEKSMRGLATVVPGNNTTNSSPP